MDKKPPKKSSAKRRASFSAESVAALKKTIAAQEKTITAQAQEIREGLEQQTAASEILRVIASSPTNLQPVLDVVAENAARLCQADDAVIFRIEGDTLRCVTNYGPMPVTEMRRPIVRGSPGGRAVVDRQAIHVHDIAAEVESEFPDYKHVQQRTGTRTVLATPLLRESIPIGVIFIRRTEVRPFTDKQIKLLETFADQAVIALENVRLFQELKESLEQQTGTSEILGVIASSPTDIQPVLDAVAANAARLCEAADAQIVRVEEDGYRHAASHGSIPVPETNKLIPVVRDRVPGRAIIDRQTIHIHDIAAEPEDDLAAPFARSVGVRTILATPNCARPWSIKPRRLRCSASSAARRPMCNRCSTPLSRAQLGCVGSMMSCCDSEWRM
jgi:GAF domain-containing protein